MTPVKRDCQEFQTLEAYVHDTHGATHRHLKVRIVNAYRVERYSSVSMRLYPITYYSSVPERRRRGRIVVLTS
jgi:hypothetical protein